MTVYNDIPIFHKNDTFYDKIETVQLSDTKLTFNNARRYYFFRTNTDNFRNKLNVQNFSKTIAKKFFRIRVFKSSLRANAKNYTR